MKKISIIFFYIFVIICTTSCTSLKEAGEVLKNEKRKTTDEFLVKKRDPLILPPEYENLPKPNSKDRSKKNNDNKINKILKLPDQSTSTSTGSSSVEESIMKNIRK